MEKKMLVRKKTLLIAAVIILIALGVWLGWTRPLGEVLRAAEMDSLVDATVIRSIPLRNADGSGSYRTEVFRLQAPPDSDAAIALTEVMGEIPCQGRWRLPFERITVCETGRDSVSITFSSGGRTRDLVLLSGSRTLYDMGISGWAYRVDDGAYEALAAVVEEYGIPQTDL
jgi:hypothetical protein